jgi:molybdopterin/thiamine biosynthesis adenylyltransferase
MEFTNQNTIFNPKEQKSKIHILGVGSVGSFVALNLSKMGFNNIVVYDFDKLENHNIPNQFYRVQDVGKLKTESIKEIIKDFSNLDIKTINEKIGEGFNFDLFLEDVFIFCFDNMESRQIAYNLLKEYPLKIIDARMGGEGFQIYSIDLSIEKEKLFYEETLKSKTKETPCGEKSIIYTILNLTSELCNILKMIDKGQEYPSILKREMKSYIILKSKI